MSCCEPSPPRYRLAPSSLPLRKLLAKLVDAAKSGDDFEGLWVDLKNEALEWSWRRDVWEEMTHAHVADEIYGALLGEAISSMYCYPWRYGDSSCLYGREVISAFSICLELEQEALKDNSVTWQRWIKELAEVKSGEAQWAKALIGHFA